MRIRNPQPGQCQTPGCKANFGYRSSDLFHTDLWCQQCRDRDDAENESENWAEDKADKEYYREGPGGNL